MNRKFTIVILALLTTGVLPSRLQAAPKSADTEVFVAREIKALVAPIRNLRDEYERDATLRLMAISLARLGQFETSLHIADSLSKDEWQANSRDEIWRITARRLAWQGNIAAATRSANRIGAEYSRADALLAIARAHLRNGNSQAAKTILLQVAPVLRPSKSPRALSYLAFLLARVGEAKTARELLAAANAIEIPTAGDLRPLLFEGTREIIALYQAKAGFSDEALKAATENKDPYALQPVKAVLAQRRDWKPLIALAEGLPATKAAYSLLQLTGTQLRGGDRQAARASWQSAKKRFSRAAPNEVESQNGIHQQVVLALLQIALGDEVGGRAFFAELSQLPNFSSEHEFVFNYFLVVPLDRDFSFIRTKRQTQEDERAALAALLNIKDNRSRVDNLLEIARAQQKRGDANALRETLHLIRTEIRQKIVAPPDKNDSVALRRLNAVSSLLAMAKIEHAAGLTSQARSTLAQSKTLATGRSRMEFARSLLYAGFADEAAAIIDAFVSSTDARALNEIKHTTENSWNPLVRLAAQHTKADGVDEALQWVFKIPDVSLRAKSLCGIAHALTPTFPEEHELILRGSQKDGARISGRIRLPGYGNSTNFDEMLD